MKRRSSAPKSSDGRWCEQHGCFPELCAGFHGERRVRFVERKPLAWPWLVILFAASVALLLFFGAALVWLAPP